MLIGFLIVYSIIAALAGLAMYGISTSGRKEATTIQEKSLIIVYIFIGFLWLPYLLLIISWAFIT